MQKELIIFQPFFDQLSNVYICNNYSIEFSFEHLKREDFEHLIHTSFVEEIFSFFIKHNFKLNKDDLYLFLNNYSCYYNNSYYENFSEDDFHSNWIDFIDFKQLSIVYLECVVKLEKNNIESQLIGF